MSKSTKPPVESGARAKERSARKLAAMLDREIQRRLGPNATFEQRNNMAAEIMREGLHHREGQDLRRMTTDDDEVDEEDGRWRRLEQPSSATYFGRWGRQEIAEPSPSSSRRAISFAIAMCRRESRSRNGALDTESSDTTGASTDELDANIRLSRVPSVLAGNDSSTPGGDPLPRVTVSLGTTPPRHTLTNETGTTIFDEVPPDRYQVEVEGDAPPADVDVVAGITSPLTFETTLASQPDGK